MESAIISGARNRAFIPQPFTTGSANSEKPAILFRIRKVNFLLYLCQICRGGNRTEEEFNKDAGMYQCKAGHLAVLKYLDRREKEKKNKNSRMTYFFDVEKCKCCLPRDGCDKYLELLRGERHPVQSEQDDEQDLNFK